MYELWANVELSLTTVKIMIAQYWEGKAKGDSMAENTNLFFVSEMVLIVDQKNSCHKLKISLPL